MNSSRRGRDPSQLLLGGQYHPVPKADKTSLRKLNDRLITLMNIDTIIFNQILAK